VSDINCSRECHGRTYLRSATYSNPSFKPQHLPMDHPGSFIVFGHISWNSLPPSLHAPVLISGQIRHQLKKILCSVRPTGSRLGPCHMRVTNIRKGTEIN